MVKKNNNIINNLHGLLVLELQLLYNVENQIVKNLPALIEAASHDSLKLALRDHWEESKKQIERLAKVFNMIDEEVIEGDCVSIYGLISQAKRFISIPMKTEVLDAAIISAVQTIEHYEISCYGSAISHAEYLDLDDVVDLLQENLKEEVAADKKLTRIAEGSFFTTGINEEALKGEEAFAKSTRKRK